MFSSENFRENTSDDTPSFLYSSEQPNFENNNDSVNGNKPTQSLFSSNIKMNPNVDMSQYAQLTRHARRIYVGGIPPNYADEEIIRNFLNSVISKGMGEENDGSYVISIYTNQKKCFAFVEVKSIELATACLDLDGIIFKKIVLKILRANEYKPELVTQAMLGKPIRLDLTSFAFGSANVPNYQPAVGMQPSLGGAPQQQHQQQFMPYSSMMALSASSNSMGSAHSLSTSNNNSNSNSNSLNSIRIESPRAVDVGVSGMSHSVQSGHGASGDLRLDSVIQFTSLNGLDSGSVVIVGFPFDDSRLSRVKNTSPANGTTVRGQGCAATPKSMRSFIRRFRYGMLHNPEFGIDLAAAKIIDVGDVLGGSSPEETRVNLSMTVSELMARGGIPYVVGGSADSSFHSIQGVMAVTGGNIGVLSISASLEHNLLLLNDSRFCPARPGAPPSCEGRYVAFAAQVMMF